MQTANRQNGSSRYVYELSPDESVSEGVIAAVSTAAGVDPVPCSAEPDASLPPLYTAIDPDALDAVFEPTAESARANGRITFQYHGYRITVHSTDRIVLDQSATPAAHRTD